MTIVFLAATVVLGFDDLPKKPHYARPTAMLLQVKGEVVAEGRLGKRRLEQGDFLLPDETVSAAADAEATLVFLKRRESRRLKPGGRATLTRDDCTPADALEKLDAPPKLLPANLTKVREVEVREGGGVGVVRGEKPAGEARVEPLSGTFITSTRPAFRWPGVPKALRYAVELRDAGGQLLWKATTKEAMLAYPEKEKPLAYGLGYRWGVRALLPEDEEKPAVEGSRFTLLFEDEVKEVETVQKLAASDAEEDLLLAAAAFEGYHLHDRALEVFEKLARLRPRVARYHEALANYYEHAGRADRVKEARETAKRLRAGGAGS
jgi:hypothetical protein